MRSAPTLKYALLSLIFLTLFAAYAVYEFSYIEDELLPSQNSVYPWRPHTSTDKDFGGSTSIDLRENTYDLSFDFKLDSGFQYSYAILGLSFADGGQPEKLVDLSGYSAISFRAKCRPGNELSFVLHTYEDGVTNISEHATFRTALSFFNCSEQWQEILVDLHRLNTPEWWLKQYNLNLSNQDYLLNKVKGLSFASSEQSPVDRLVSVSIGELRLQGRNWYMVYSAIAIGLFVWGMFSYCYIRQLLGLREASSWPQEASLMPYKQVTIDSKQDREKSAVLDYLASEYTNPDLSVEIVVKALGLNRAKINDVLREEAGLTFSAYLNKLRLTEAARLLSLKRMGVAEAAYAVGYRSVSYFNRVFKKQYSCTPSSYKAPADKDSDSATPP